MEGVAGFCKYPIITKAGRPLSNKGRALRGLSHIHCTGYNEYVKWSGLLETGGSSSVTVEQVTGVGWTCQSLIQCWCNCGWRLLHLEVDTNGYGWWWFAGKRMKKTKRDKEIRNSSAEEDVFRFLTSVKVPVRSCKNRESPSFKMLIK